MPVALAVLFAAACSSRDDTTNAAADSDDLVFEVFHAAIDGIASPAGRERLAALAPALSEDRADVVCLQGVASPDDRAALRTALASVYPFSLDLPTNDDATVDDRRDVTGRIPDAPSKPPCQTLGAADRYAGCLFRAGCTAELGGVVSVYGCIVHEFCWPQSDLDADPDRRCVACMADHLRVGELSSVAAERCEGLVEPLVNHGQHGTMLLSRLPLTRPSIAVLPAVSARRVVLGASVTTPHGRDLDVFCARLGPTVDTELPDDPLASEPYSGVYGGARDGWLRENELHVQRLIEHVTSVRGERPAVIMGNFGTSSEVRANGVVLPPAGPIGARRLESTFTPAIAPDWQPSCTVCRESSFVSLDITETFANRIFLAGLDAATVRASTRTHLGNIIDLAEPQPFAPSRFPLSMQYGFRSRIAIPAN